MLKLDYHRLGLSDVLHGWFKKKGGHRKSPTWLKKAQLQKSVVFSWYELVLIGSWWISRSHDKNYSQLSRRWCSHTIRFSEFSADLGNSTDLKLLLACYVKTRAHVIIAVMLTVGKLTQKHSIKKQFWRQACVLLTSVAGLQGSSVWS